jgi:hypothetical protein
LAAGADGASIAFELRGSDGVARRGRGLTTFFADPDKYPVEDRAVAYTIAFFSPKHRGGGSFYLITFNDKDGHGL